MLRIFQAHGKGADSTALNATVIATLHIYCNISLPLCSKPKNECMYLELVLGTPWCGGYQETVFLYLIALAYQGMQVCLSVAGHSLMPYCRHHSNKTE